MSIFDNKTREEDKSKDVVDQESYDQYQNLLEHPILNKDRYIITSDEQKIDLARNARYIRNNIKHLPQEEKDDIESKISFFSSIKNKAQAARRKAFGQRVGRKPKGITVFDQKAGQIIELFGRMFSIKEVAEIIRNQWKFNVDLEELKRFRKQHNEEIKLKIEEHKRNYGNIRLAVKRSRLEEYTLLYNKHKERYLETLHSQDHKQCLAVLEQIKKEVEDDESFVVNGNLNISIDNSINYHLNEEVLRTVNIKEIIIARIAAKKNKSAADIIAALHKSYYATMSRMLHGSDANYNMDQPYPSKITFDFDQIEHEHREVIDITDNEDNKQEFKEQEVDEEQSSKAKSKILQLLEEKQKDLNSERQEISNYVDIKE